MIERFPLSLETTITPEEKHLIEEVEGALLGLIPCGLSLARRFYTPTARLLVLGTTRAGLSGLELTTCRGIIVAARNAMHEATARR